MLSTNSILSLDQGKLNAPATSDESYWAAIQNAEKPAWTFCWRWLDLRLGCALGIRRHAQ